jgi:hypothetical protein
MADAIDAGVLGQQRAPLQALPDLLRRHSFLDELRSGDHAVLDRRQLPDDRFYRPGLWWHDNH